MKAMASMIGLAASLASAAPALAANDKPLANWFGDPYFEVRHAVVDCPTPLGPLTTGDELQTQTHARSERGTRCWLEGRCTRPNSYLYDKDIADGVKQRFASTKAYRDASLWVTVQRRIVWIEGCVAPGYRSGSLDRLAASVPDVELVVVNVRKGPKGDVPYRQLPAGAITR
jgi:hypothetical protein